MTTRPLRAALAASLRGPVRVVDIRDRRDGAVSCTREGVREHTAVADLSLDCR